MLNFCDIPLVASFFLETAGALDKYNANLVNVAENRTYSSLQEAVMDDPANWLIGSFPFSKTPEGFDYWERLFNSWTSFFAKTL